MPKSHDSYEIYVSPAGIRVCSAGWDQYHQWTEAPLELERCFGHNTFGPEAVIAQGLKSSGKTTEPS